MATLSELKTAYAKRPVTLGAIEKAIAIYGAAAEAVVSKGLPSTNVRSNLHKCAKREGYKSYEYFVGARAGKNANDGNYNVIVKLS